MHRLLEQLGIALNRPELLEKAFVHRSFVNENRRSGMEDNERLEYLGDAVLELVITEALFHGFPNKPEGELTSLRSALVRKENLSIAARELDLGKYLKLSHGEESSGGRKKDYLLANAFEAMLGAIYLDRGYGVCQTLIRDHLLPGLSTILENALHIDPKSAFQEFTQEVLKITPRYEVLSESGPDHGKTFTVTALLGDKQIAKGKGGSKRKAEEEAAKAALAKLRKLHKAEKAR